MTENCSTMNCEDFRQAIAADPGATDAALAAHAAECAACREYRNEYRALDEKIAAALSIPVPELSMPELDAPQGTNVVELKRRPRFAPPTWFGLAAGLALAAFFGLQLMQPDLDDVPLAAQVLEHLDHEPYSRVVTTVAVPERTLDAVVTNDVAELSPGIGLVTYARSCVINGKSIPHLVIQGERGPVTLLMMPDEPIEQAIPLDGNGVNGIILPLGDGSIAIVGERDESIENIQNRVVDSVKWKT